MTIHFLNCFTCNARVPADWRTGTWRTSTWRTGTLCLLIESIDGLILVDTGPGTADYRQPPGILRAFRLLTKVRMDPQECALQQVQSLGFRVEDVRHIILTHMHFDHCGGLPDFPHAAVHVHAREYQAFARRPRQFTELAYVRRHVAHQPKLTLYHDAGQQGFDFPAVRLQTESEIWMVPLPGHSAGHCGIAIRTENGWLFHVGDAAPVGLEDYAPSWLVRRVLGPHTPRLRRFRDAHPEIRITTGHMWLNFFESSFQPK